MTGFRKGKRRGRGGFSRFLIDSLLFEASAIMKPQGPQGPQVLSKGCQGFYPKMDLIHAPESHVAVHARLRVPYRVLSLSISLFYPHVTAFMTICFDMSKYTTRMKTLPGNNSTFSLSYPLCQYPLSQYPLRK